MLNIPDDYISSIQDDMIAYDFGLTVAVTDDKVKFSVDDLATSWMGLDDNFTKRIQFEKLNSCFLKAHLAKEIEIKNELDCGAALLEDEKYRKAIGMFDDVLYYDSQYGEALLFKSKALFGQGHFVKSLRHYKKAVKSDDGLNDVEYHKLLLKRSSEERGNFPKIKQNIYAGDEYFAKGDFERALESYERALANPTDFKRKILSKLLNKKGTALLKLNRIDDAIDAFRQSAAVKPNDYAYFYLGLHDLNCEEFKRPLKITKKQLIIKARKLNDSGEVALASDCLDEFFDNHYAVDEDYKNALDLKFEIFKRLGKDTGEIEAILKAL